MKAKTKVFDNSTYDFDSTPADEAAYKIEFCRRDLWCGFAEKMSAPLADTLKRFYAFCAEHADVIDDAARDMMASEIRVYKAEFDQAYNC